MNRNNLEGVVGGIDCISIDIRMAFHRIVKFNIICKTITETGSAFIGLISLNEWNAICY